MLYKIRKRSQMEETTMRFVSLLIRNNTEAPENYSNYSINRLSEKNYISK